MHGGERVREPVLIDADVEAALRELTALAPLHQPKSLAALDAVQAVLPEVLAVACFDTAFHATLTASACNLRALPRALARALGGRRPRRLALLGCRRLAGRGARRPLSRHNDGFTPLDGLVMATRSGSVDPGLLLWLFEETGMAERELAEALQH